MALHVMDEANRCLGCKVSPVSERVSYQHSHPGSDQTFKGK